MMWLSYSSRSIKTSHCIGASYVRDNIDRHFSEQEQQENQKNPAKYHAELDKGRGYFWKFSSSGHSLLCKRSCPNGLLETSRILNSNKRIITIYSNLRRRKQPIQSAANFQNLFLIAALGSRGLTSRSTLRRNLSFNHLWRAITNKRSSYYITFQLTELGRESG